MTTTPAVAQVVSTNRRQVQFVVVGQEPAVSRFWLRLMQASDPTLEGVYRHQAYTVTATLKPGAKLSAAKLKKQVRTALEQRGWREVLVEGVPQ